MDHQSMKETYQDAPTVRLTELEQKAVMIAEGYKKLPRQDRIGIIAQAFGCKSGKIETTPCGGKWRGTSDISIRFDNGESLAIGNHRTPQAKTVKVQNECINSALVRYNPEIIAATKEAAVAALRAREVKDNEIAAGKGLKPYTLLGVEFNDGTDGKSGGYKGWYYVTLAVGGEIRAHMETGLNYDISDGKVSESHTRENYFAAGAFKESDVDYVFNNVGFSSKSRLYSLPISEEVRKRAEKALAERGETQQKTGPGQDAPGTLPDPTIGVGDMEQYGYVWDGMLPLRETAAVTLFEKEDLEIFLLHDDGSESLAESVDDIHRHADRGGIMGVHREDWNALCGYREMKRELVPDDLMTGETVTTPRGSFHLTSMSREQMEACGYGVHHTSKDGKYFIMGNGTRAFAVAAVRQEKKPSIRAQLAQDAEKTAPKKTAAKAKNRGLEI